MTDTDLTPVEYLDHDSDCFDACHWNYEYGRLKTEREHADHHASQVLITKKTTKRIYFADRFGRIYCIDRTRIENEGSVWHPKFQTLLYLSPPPLYPQQPDLRQLRQAWADAHPDRGGNEAEFTAAGRRYHAARRAAP